MRGFSKDEIWLGAMILAGCGGLVLAIQYVCSLFSLVELETLDRFRSPDGSMEAVVFTSNGGATTSYGFNVDIVRPGQEPDLDHAPYICDHTGKVMVRWEGPERLIIHQTGRVFKTDPTTSVRVSLWSSRVVRVMYTGQPDEP